MKSAAFWGAFLFVSASITFSAFGAGPQENTSRNEMNFGGFAPNAQVSYVAAGTGEAPASGDVVLNDILVSGSGVMGNQNPLIGIVPLDNGMIEYKVKRGDTFSGIAEQFQTTIADIKLANQNIKYPPLNSWIMIPTAAATSALSAVADSAHLPDLRNYFSLPAQGLNSGELYPYNAVDIANQCGTPVYAAAEGLVVADPNLGSGSSGWNDGYGIFVFIEHPNGTKTRYAHLEESLVKVGDYVKKGQEVGLMGNTGNSEGPTGCHLHFEVYGAKNPFAIN